MGNNKDNVSNTMLKLESQKITAVQFAQSAKKKKKAQVKSQNAKQYRE